MGTNGWELLDPPRGHDLLLPAWMQGSYKVYMPGRDQQGRPVDWDYYHLACGGRQRVPPFGPCPLCESQGRTSRYTRGYDAQVTSYREPPRMYGDGSGAPTSLRIQGYGGGGGRRPPPPPQTAFGGDIGSSYQTNVFQGIPRGVGDRDSSCYQFDMDSYAAAQCPFCRAMGTTGEFGADRGTGAEHHQWKSEGQGRGGTQFVSREQGEVLKKDQRHEGNKRWQIFDSDDVCDPHTIIRIDDTLVEARPRRPVHISEEDNYDEWHKTNEHAESLCVGDRNKSLRHCHVAYSNTVPMTHAWVSGVALHFDDLVKLTFTKQES